MKTLRNVEKILTAGDALAADYRILPPGREGGVNGRLVFTSYTFQLPSP